MSFATTYHDDSTVYKYDVFSLTGYTKSWRIMQMSIVSGFAIRMGAWRVRPAWPAAIGGKGVLIHVSSKFTLLRYGRVESVKSGCLSIVLSRNAACSILKMSHKLYYVKFMIWVFCCLCHWIIAAHYGTKGPQLMPLNVIRTPALSARRFSRSISPVP